MQLIKASRQSFDILLDFLEEHGNPVLGRRWRVDKDGQHTYMTKPIDMELVAAHFATTGDVELNFKYRIISSASEWLEILYSQYENT